MNDLRYACRQLLKNPGFTAVAVLTLGLGIGAATAMFGLIQGVLLSPPPYAEPDRLVLVSPARIDGQPFQQGCTIGQWQEWRKASQAIQAPALYSWTFNFLVLPDGSESLVGMVVTKEFFAVLGVKAMIGHEFTESEIAAPNAPPCTIILGHDLWRRRFNGDPNIIGKSVHISRHPAPLTVVGVMPRGVRFLPDPSTASEPNYDVNAHVDFWLPVAPDETKPKSWGWNAVTRLREGATLQKAQAEVTALTARHAGTDPDLDGITAKVLPVQDELNQEARRLLMPLLGAVALLFLIACGNVAGLLLARGLQLRDQMHLPLRSVTPDYFDALGIKVVDGRGFRPSDNSEAPDVAVVNEALAGRYFPKANPIGRKMRFVGDTNRMIEVVGIVSNTRTEALSHQAEPEIYFPFWQSGAFSKHLIVRAASDPRPLAALVKRELQSVDPTAAVEHARTMEDIRRESVAPRTFAMRLLIGFSLAASALALVGIYGVVSLSVGARTKEIAVRMAIGAQWHEILRLILGEGFRLIVLGVVLGAIIAVSLGRVLEAFLFETKPADPVTLGGVALLFAAVALVACSLPASRAARVDPMEALRYE